MAPIFMPVGSAILQAFVMGAAILSDDQGGGMAGRELRISSRLRTRNNS